MIDHEPHEQGKLIRNGAAARSCGSWSKN